MKNMNLEDISTIIENRKKNMPAKSYIASLFRGDADRIAQKVGEEAVEVVIAAKNLDKKRTIEEITDLFFHTLVLMQSQDITLDEIYKELDRRRTRTNLYNSDI